MSSMSFMDKLMDGVGVEWKVLWEVTTWDKKFNAVSREKQPNVINYKYLLAIDLFKLEKENGDVFLLSTGERTGWTTEELAGENLREGEVVTIPWGKSRPLREVIKYYKGRFVTADNRIATSNDTDKLLNKFLYYWMFSQAEVIDTFYRGAGIQHPSMAAVLGMEIPIPPLHIQAKIVRILDAFTAMTAQLTAELTAELNLRKKQYKYYLDKLLSFKDDEVKWKALGEVANFANGKGHEKDIIEDGEYIVVNSKFISSNGRVAKYSNKQICPLFINDILLVMSDLPNGKALAKTFIVDADDRYTLNQRIGGISVKNKNELHPKFLYYFLNRNPQLTKFNNGVDQTNLRKEQILGVQIPILSLTEQTRIVTILDKFDTLIYSINEGLPREIELRQQQYEYYRDLLFSFPKPEEVEA